MIKERRYVLASDPTEKYIAPVLKDAVPYLNFSSLQNAVSDLEKSASLFGDLSGANSKPVNVRQLNRILFQAEQKLLSAEGLPRRAWYTHTIYAPGYYTGYGVKTLPGIREAIEQRNWTEAQEQIEVVARAVHQYTLQVDEANRILGY